MARQTIEISPVLSAHSSKSHSRVNTPSSSVPSTPVVPERPPSPEKKALHDSNAFLTALAAQERKVLELKEELQRAEANLEKLKKQWTVHETTKKRNELRQVAPLQPLTAQSPGVDTPADQETVVSGEQEKRKQRHLTTRQTQRTVFSGSRHTKTLSLLTPKPSVSDLSQPSITPWPKKARRGTIEGSPRSKIVQEITSTSNMSDVSKSSRPRESVSGPPKDPILDAGKQLVGDFKDGLWTFFEDLRQATVGEEIDTSNGKVVPKSAAELKETIENKVKLQRENVTKSQFPARQSSLHGRASHTSKVSAETVSTNEPKPVTPCKTKRQRHLTVTTAAAAADADSWGWDYWDSPPSHISPPRLSTSVQRIDVLASSTTEQSSPCTSSR